MGRAVCPVCGEPVELPEDVLAGEIVEHDCGATLEVVLGPEGQVSLRVFEGVEEDWGE